MGCSSSSHAVRVAEPHVGKSFLAKTNGKPKAKRSKQSNGSVRKDSLPSSEVLASVAARAPSAPARPEKPVAPPSPLPPGLLETGKPIAPPSPLPPGLPETGLPGEVNEGHQGTLRDTATTDTALPVPPVGAAAPALRSPAAPATSGLVLLTPTSEEAPHASGVDCTINPTDRKLGSRPASRPGTGIKSSRPGTGVGAATRPGTGATRPGTGVTRPGTDAARPGTGPARPGTGGLGVISQGAGVNPGSGGQPPSRPGTRPGTVASTTASIFGLFPPSSRGTVKDENMVDLFDEIEVAEDKAVAFELEGWMSGVRKTLLMVDENAQQPGPLIDDIKLCNTVAATPAAQRMQALISGDDELLMQQILEDSEDFVADEAKALF